MVIRSRTTLRITGMNVERMLTTLISNSIKILKVDRYSKSEFLLEIYTSSVPKIFGITKKLCYTITVVKQTGIKSILSTLLNRIMIPITAAICAVLLIYASGRVDRFELFGLPDGEIGAVQDFLVANGYVVGMSIDDIDCDALESVLKHNFNSIALVSVIKKGRTVLINVERRFNPPELYPRGIYASCDGVITDIRLVSGTLAVEVGDVVKKGQILVYPTCVVNGETRDINAVAEIYADTEVSNTTVFRENDNRLVRNGNKVSCNSVSMLGIGLVNGYKPDFEYYELEHTERLISNILPILLKTDTYYEMEYMSDRQSFDDVKQGLIENNEYKTLSQVEQGTNVLDVSTTVTSVGETYYITTYVKMNKCICTGEK